MEKWCTIAIEKIKGGLHNIIFTVTNDLSYDQRMQRICTTLARNGYNCLLVGRKRKDSMPLGEFAFNTHRLRCFFNAGKLFYFEYNLRLLFFLMRQPFDAVCAIDLDTLMACGAVSVLRRRKLGYDAHEYFTEVPEVVSRPLVKSIWHRVAKYWIPKTHFRYTVGSALAKELDKMYQKPFDVIRNVPYESRLKGEKEYSQSEKKILIYQGALNEGRGLEPLIDAASELPVEICLAGEGDLSLALRERVARKGLEEKVVFLGWVTPERLKEITRKAFLGYNLLEKRGKSYYLSLANKYFDYTMAQVPCLVSAFPEYVQLHREYGHSVICELTKEAIVANINHLIDRPDEYQKLVKNCEIAAKTLNWEMEEQKLLKIYNHVFR